MRLRVARLGAVEWVFIFAALVLIVAEGAALRGGFGYYAAILTLGYIVAVATAYVLYRHDKIEASTRAASAAILENVDIFKDLSPEEIDAVASQGRRIEVPAGTLLGTAGEPGSHLYIIVEGQGELTAPSAVGEITVRVVGPGESFPLASVIGSGTLITTATAMSDMEAVAIPRADLLSLWEERPELGMRMFAAIAGVLAGRYRNTLAHMSESASQALRRADFWANV